MKFSFEYLIIVCLLLSSTRSAFAQTIFSTKFEGCNTDHFVLESDTTTAKINSVEFVQKLEKHLLQQVEGKIRGKLQLQVIVNLDGSSCLISLENKTNVEIEELEMKKFIDKQINWSSPSKKIGAIIALDFQESGTNYRRLGMNGQRGWHFLRD